MDSDILRHEWPYFQFQRLRLSEKIPTVEFQRKIFRRIALESCPTSERPMNCFGELPSNSPRRVVQ